MYIFNGHSQPFDENYHKCTERLQSSVNIGLPAGICGNLSIDHPVLSDDDLPTKSLIIVKHMTNMECVRAV